MKKSVVFGSFVVDLMARSPRLPQQGETVIGSLFQMGAGGKGFNQCVAAHKAGADVTMMTKVGNDSFANVALDMMAELNMDTSGMLRGETATGCALILVDANTSQNEIVVVPGACGDFNAQDLQTLRPALEQADFLLTQLETNLQATQSAIAMVHQAGGRVILNPAPAQAVPEETLSMVYAITPNETEAELLTGIALHTLEDMERASQWFIDRGVQVVIITLGSKGVYVCHGQQGRLIAANAVDAVDTTGAGDAFNGGLLTALAEGQDIYQSVAFAQALAGLSVQKIGTACSMPNRADIDAVLYK